MPYKSKQYKCYGLSEAALKIVNEVVKRGLFPSRSAAVEYAIMSTLSKMLAYKSRYEPRD